MQYALVDFDGDGYLSKEDLIDTIKCLCGEEELKPQEMQLVADKIIEVYCVWIMMYHK